MRARTGLIACATCLAALILAAPSSAAVTAEFVKDLNDGVQPSEPGNFVNVEGVVFFAATDSAHGTELWSTDGTVQGTNMVKDINPGPSGSFPADLTSVDGKLAFAATEDSTGTELYETDGTTAGTVLIEDLRPGTDSSNPSDLTDVDGTLFFAADDAVAGAELWTSDGTEAGTSVVEDINPNGSDGSNPQGLRAASGALYFAADDGSNGTELWISDGSAGGTSMLDDINTGTDSSDPGELTELNGTLFFAASTELAGRELWAKNLSGGPSYLVSDINPGMIGSVPASSFPAGLTVLNNRILFKAAGGLAGQGLWSSDGTLIGTTQLHAMDSMSQALKRVGGTVFFVGFDSVHGSELWKSDGSSAGTQVLDVTPGSSDTAITLFAGFATAQGRLFFAAGTDNELWSSDGTVAGTGEVANINPTGPSSPHNLVDIQGRLHFAADDGNRGSELWRTRIDLDPTINSGPTGPTNQARPTFTFSSNDDLATYTCSLDTGTPSFEACSGALSHQPAADLADGDYVFRVRATDDLGNYATAARAFSIDTVVPSLSITGGPIGNTTDQRPTFTFDGEAGATLQCSIDTGSANFGPCSGASSHQPAADLADGPYTFRVRATDAAGNPTTETRTFTVVDATPPTLSITGGPTGLTNDPRPVFSFDAEAGATVECSIDTGTPSYGSCSSAASHQPASDLVDDAYTFRVRATDAASNATTRTRNFSVDATPPTLSITGGPSGPTDEQRPTFTFDPEAGASVECSIDTGTPGFGPCSAASGHQPASDLADGSYTFRVQATDAAGNLTTQTSDFSVDTVAPSLSITGGPTGATSDPRPTFTFNADVGSTVECSIDAGTASFAACSGTSSHQPASDLADDGYTFRVRATDAAGNSTTQTRAFSVDTTAPTLTITGGPSSATNDARPTFTFDTGAGATVECSIDTGTASFGACSGASSHQPTSDLADGSYTFRVRATDAPGNSTTHTRAFSVDTVAPSLSITGGPTGVTNDARPTFTFTAGAGATLECSIDTGSASFGACSAASSHEPAADLADGSYTFRVRATDAAGNAATQTRSFSVDVTAPSLSITGGPTGDTGEARPTFDFSAEAGATVECSIDTGLAGFGACSGASSHQPASDLANGSYTFRVRATDAAGNSATRTRAFTVVDDVPPSLSITGGPTGLTNDPRPAFTFDAEAGATVQCSIDTGTASFGPCSGGSSHQPASDLADGSYTFRVRATDGAGNTATRTRAFSVDATAPTLTITGGPTSATNDARPTFTFTAAGGSTVTCSIDAGSPNFGPCSGASSHEPTSDLANGSYTFRVQATDAAGNSTAQTRAFSVDTVAPSLSITGGPTGATSDPRPTFTFDAETGSAVQCSIDTGTANFGSCSGASSHQPASDLANGSYTFRVRATDAAGNVTTRTQSFSVDTSAPSLVITGGPTGVTNDARPTFTFTAAGGATVTCSIDTGTASFGPCSGASSHQPSADLADGPYTFRVRATDGAGNSTTQTRSFTVDTVAPSLAITGGPAGTTSDARPTFDFDAEAGSTVECSIDTGTAGFGPCSGASSHEPSADLADGSYTFRVRATDAAGNPTTKTRAFTVVVDTTPPSLSITGGPTGTTSDHRPTFTFTAEAGSTVECSIDTGTAAFGPCSGASSHQPSSDLADGSYTFRVRATDAAGNAATQTRSFTVDSAAPSLVITGGPTGDTNDARPTFTFTAAAGSTVTCSIDTGSAGFGPCSGASSHQPASDLADGSYTFRVRATDAAGNAATQTRSFTVDTAAPALSITGGPAGPTGDARPTFTFNAGAGSVVECSIDTGSASFGPCSGASSHGPSSDLADGLYTFRVRATDPAGNSTTQTRSFSVDTVAPSLAITGGPTGTTGDARPTFTFTAEAGTTVECSIDTGTAGFGPCSGASSHQPSADLADGSYTFRVRATDAAGNAATQTRAFTVVVDTTPPSLSITGGPTGTTGDPRPTFDFSAEAGSTVQCSIDTGTASFGPCSGASSHQPAADLADGSYTFRVRATDAAGNAATQTRSFTVDSAAPSLSITGGPSGGTNNARPTFTFTAGAGATVSCSIDLGTAAFGPCSGASSHRPAADLADGDYVFRVRATDGAGNSATQTRTFTVDTLAPSLAITGGPAGTTSDVRPSFDFDAEAGSTLECSIDTGSAGFGPCSGASSHQTASDLANGSYVFRVRAADSAGNVATETQSFSVDTSAPSLVITGGPTGDTNDRRPSFTFTAAAGSTVTCSIDTGSASFGPCAGASSHQPAADLADGSYTFRVRATDGAGNSATQTRPFTVDTAAPSVAITGGPTGATNDVRPSFDFTAEAGAGLQCSIDNGTASFGSCASVASHEPTADLADAGYTFRVRATDAAGNSTTQTRSFTVDTVAPSLTITGGPTGTTSDARPNFTFTAGAGATLACSIDTGSAGFGPCSGGGNHQPAADLADGSYTFRVGATDAAGNAATQTRSFAVATPDPPPPPDPPVDPPVDPPAPDVTITGGPTRSTKDRTPTFTFASSNGGASFRCSVDGKAAAPCSSPSTLKKLKYGKHTFSVTAVSAAGKQSAVATRSFKVKRKRRR